jgi:predicted RNase H-like nuclease (RuvC/YqgF family)
MQAESSHRPTKIKRHIKPPTVRQPPGQFESSDEEEEVPKEPTIAQLSTSFTSLRLENRRLHNLLAEYILKTKNLEDDIDHIRRGVGMKIYRLAKAVGRRMQLILTLRPSLLE